MIPKGLFTQIAIIILSVGIIFSYVKPAFELIGKNQNQIGVYKEELVKVAEVNDKLSRLSSNVSAIDDDDQRRLLTYMPDTIDTIMIPRTLEAIAKEAEVVLKKVSSENVSVNSSSADGLSATNQTDQPKAAAFSMDVEGSYDQIKNLLRLLEQNEYPLEVKSLKITKVDDGFLNVGLTITTYSLQLPGEGASINEVTL